MLTPRWFFALLLLLIAVAAQAQTHFDVGLSLAQQAYAAPEDDPRYLPGIEFLVRRDAWGGHVAAEYADLSVAEGPLVAIHTNAVRRFGSGRWIAMLGLGPTLIVRNNPKEVTWNAEAEVAHAWSRVELFARVRHYDYELPSFRAGDVGPSGPAVSLGVRFKLRE